MALSAKEVGILHKYVYELCYDYGYTYLDRCGATINDILRSNPGWFASGVNPNSGVLRNPDKEITFTFGPLKLALSQEQSEKISELIGLEDFARLAEDFTQKVVQRLEIDEFTRIGFRVWRLSPAPSLEDASNAVKRLEMVSLENLQEFGLSKVEEVSCTLVTHEKDYPMRIAITPIEQNIRLDAATLEQAKIEPQKLAVDQRRARIAKLKAKHRVEQFPQFATLLDIDSWLEYPPYPEDLGVAEFIVRSYNGSLELASKVFTRLVKG